MAASASANRFVGGHPSDYRQYRGGEEKMISIELSMWRNQWLKRG
jgi:hypothetical protein